MRKPRILWANYSCLLDGSSGASISVRQILLQLLGRGIEVSILGATIFDSPRGAEKLINQLQSVGSEDYVELVDGPLKHVVTVTKSTVKSEMSAAEIEKWYVKYQQTLADYRPDLVIYYGGKSYDFLIADETRARGIPTAFYLANGNYHGNRWCRDVDLILTDSHATANLYQQRLGLSVNPVGKFIARERIVTGPLLRQNLLFINPSPAKGGFLVVLLAKLLLQRRPDICIEVVESRGGWDQTLSAVSDALQIGEAGLPNVKVTQNTPDVRPLYARARLVLLPSLWWESGGRVLAEAMLNGIPAIATDRGGAAEMIGSAGVLFDLPPECYEAPYNRLPSAELLEPLVDKIIELYDNENYYQQLVGRAKVVGESVHNMALNTDRLIECLEPLLQQQAGDLDLEASLTSVHKHSM